MISVIRCEWAFLTSLTDVGVLIGRRLRKNNIVILPVSTSYYIFITNYFIDKHININMEFNGCNFFTITEVTYYSSRRSIEELGTRRSNTD